MSAVKQSADDGFREAYNRWFFHYQKQVGFMTHLVRMETFYELTVNGHVQDKASRHGQGYRPLTEEERHRLFEASVPEYV